ncbi:MAG: chitobiase/beta-hexosaminidase C-terminal domain-containing protein [Bacteroidaceae bacterium]|nr:chitobiase/beta-hexosaminidase C-terminal domain-containing protein [Bacteroidaceae bacterium]
MKKFLLSFLCFLLAVGGGYAEEVEATLSFANTAQRTSFSTDQQVWEQNGIKLTNKKSSSTSDVANYAKPARFYKNSEIIVECTQGKITQIVFDCNSTAYATSLKKSIGNAATASSDKVTVALDGSSKEFVISKLSDGQVRMDALTVTYTPEADGELSKPVTPALTAGGNFVGSMEVEISCDTEGAEIFYTIDGTDPTEDSEAYIKPLEITETTTVKAIAVNEAGESRVATATYTRVAAIPEISFNEATFEESVVVTITAAEGTTAYYTLNSKTPTEDSDKCPGTLTLKANATLQVIAYDEDGYASPLVKQTFTKKASDVSGTPIGMATLVKDATDLAVGDQVVIVASDYNYALSTNQKSSNRGAVEVEKNESSITMNNEVQTLTLKSGLNSGTFSFYTGDGYLYAGSASGNQLKTKLTQDDKGCFTINIDNSGVATVNSSNVEVRGLINFNYNNGSPLFACYDPNNKQSDVSLYKVDISTVKNYVLNVTSAGWSTLYLDYNVAIPENVTCYVASEVGEESVQLTEVEGVLPANTAVIVNAEEGEYTFEVTEETATVESIMAGTTKNEYITKDGYILAQVDDKVGLYKASMNGGVFLNNANKAYLPASALPASVQNAKALKFNFDTTGVEGVKVETAGKKVIYDLSGRRVNEMAQPGIYIVNGKKVMVK